MTLIRLVSVRLILWFFILILLPLPFIVLLLTELSMQFSSTLFGIIAGLVGYIWMLLSMYLSTRPHWLDRLIGLPEVYMMHGLVALVAILSAWIHKMLVHSGGMISLTGDVGLYIFSGVLAYSLVMMAGWITRKIVFLQAMKQYFSRFINHEWSVWLHRLNVVGVVVIFFHVQLIGYISRLNGFMDLFDGFSFIVIGYYFFYKWIQPHLDISAQLISRTEIGDNIQELTVQLPPKYRWHAGDWLFIRFPHYKELREAHPFSIVNLPDETGRLKLAIRGDGDFTRYLKTLSPEIEGIHVKLTRPFGQYHQFLKQHHEDQPLIIVAGGIGITPFISIAQMAVQRQQPVTFLYSTKHEKDAIYLDELTKFNQSDIYFKHQIGRFSDTQIVDMMQKNGIYLLAGPHAMTKYWRNFLKNRGVADSSIYFEPFEW